MAQVTCAGHKTIGQGFSNEEQLIRLVYDFSEDGGAFADSFKMATVGSKLLVLDSRVHVLDAFTSGGSATAIIGISGGDTDAFLDATSGAVASLTDDAIATETAGQNLILAAGSVIELDVGTADMTAGKLELVLRVCNAD